ncbi:NAD-dependent epimerase/dehydratase family protein [Nioella sediminis]|uniref:NAD-dependent epimerase/dehydratase family protein n=1 Tax=Nioella sediminis TaxID=1912092 RepID=UPI0008FD667A|nr:NAD-dependent epimerase/dehydratase family protein [Nioella sediminis]TBX28241.1 epimerase [Roseovarius sp. JS7-11]
MPRTALILGASGSFGHNAAQAFEEAGWTVRRFDRKTGDMIRDAQGVDVIVNAMNPPNYHAWDKLIPQITGQVLAAAKASGAAVLLPGNVYVFGDQPGPWSETTPHRPIARKGRVRAEMEAAYRQAAQDGVQVIILRGGDFVDPDSPNTVLNLVSLKAVSKGRITSLGRPDVPRAYAYLPDMARAAVALAERRRSLSLFEDVPFPGHTFSMTELASALQAQMGRPLRMRGFPWWALRLASPVWELARELTEMRYLYDTPHRLDGTRFRQVLPDFEETSFGKVVKSHLPKGQRAGSGKSDVHPDEAMA